MVNRSELGKFIKDKRNEKSLSTHKLAELAQVSQSYIAQLESGRKKSPPSPDILRKLAPALDVEYGELMEIAGYTDENQRSSYGKSIIFDGILLMINRMMNAFPNSPDFINDLQQFRQKLMNLEPIRELMRFYSEIEIKHEALAGEILAKSEIKGMLTALKDINLHTAEMDLRGSGDDFFKEITNYVLRRKGITYNGHKLKNSERDQILAMLAALFPQYASKKEED